MSSQPLPITGDTSAYRLAAGQKVLNRYIIQRLLGRGGMGVVWLARDEALDLDVALKFVPSLVVNDRVSLEELKRETRRNLTLTHPNIVRTYDFVQGGSLAGISMEYMDGDTLRNRRHAQPSGVFDPADLREWTFQFTEALHYAHHTASIVHRDLKPANLLLNGRNQLKVADFGIARSLGESVAQVSGRNMSTGTVPYMSPQQLDGEPADPLDDIYALGATLYELCTSRPPFYSGELSRQIVLKLAPSMAARRAELGLPAGTLPQNWETTIAACLAKERAQRPQDAREVAARLGLREAAAVRTASKPLPVLQKIAVTPLKPVTAPLVVPPSQADWKTRSLDTALRSGRAALAATPVVLHKVKENRRIALAAAAAVFLAAIALLFWFRGPQAGAGAKAAATGSASPNPAQPGRVAGGQGSVFVETDPPGAMAQVDGQPAQKTPVLLKNLAAGKHPISVRMDGYEDYDGEVSVKADQVAEAGKIQLSTQTGQFAVTTNPPGAEILVRGPASLGVELHQTSPWDSGKLPVGEYEITATRPGRTAVAQKVLLTKDQAAPVAFDLMGSTVHINSFPAKATVLVDGKPVGVTPCDLEDVQPGAIKYSVVLEGYGPTEVDGTVEPGQPLVLEAKLGNLAEASKPSHPESAQASHPHDDDEDHDNGGDKKAHRTHKPSGGKKSGGGGDDLLSKLKRLPLPFWHH